MNNSGSILLLLFYQRDTKLFAHQRCFDCRSAIWCGYDGISIFQNPFRFREWGRGSVRVLQAGGQEHIWWCGSQSWTFYQDRWQKFPKLSSSCSSLMLLHFLGSGLVLNKIIASVNGYIHEQDDNHTPSTLPDIFTCKQAISHIYYSNQTSNQMNSSMLVLRVHFPHLRNANEAREQAN